MKNTSVFLIIALVSAPLCGGVGINAVRSAFMRYDFTGIVRGPIETKTTGTNEIGDKVRTRYMVPLSTRDGPVVVSCSSEQCAFFPQGKEVKLSCYKEFHFFEPDENECK